MSYKKQELFTFAGTWFHPRFIVAHHFNFLCFVMGVKFLFSSCVFCVQCFQCLLIDDS